MRLDRLEGSRGSVRFALNMERITYVRGENESGKTSLLAVLAFGVNGPGRDRIPSDQVATLTWSDPAFRIARTYRPAWETGEETEHTVLVHADGLKVADKVKTAEHEILRNLGAAWTWDAGAVFGATPTERRKAIGALVGPAIGKAAVIAALKEGAASFSDAPQSLQERLKHAAEAVRRAPETAGPEAASSWLDGIRAAKTQAQRDSQNLHGTLATIEARLEAAGVPEGSLVVHQEQWTAANDRLVELEKRRAAAESTRRLRAELEGRRARAIRLRDNPAPAEELARLARFEHELAGKMTAAEAAKREAEQARRDLEANLSVASAVQVLRPLLAELVAELDIHTLVRDLDPVVKVRRLLDEPDRAEEWRTALRAAEARADAAVRVRAAKDRELALATHTLETVRREHATTAANHTRQQAEVARILADAEAELAAVAPTLDELPTDLGVEQLTAQIEAARSERDTVNLLIERMQTYSALVADQERSARLVANAADDRSALHQFEKRAEEAIGKLYATAMRPLVDPASRITEAVLGRAVAIDPALDWWIGLGHEPVEHVSTSTAAILGVAIRAAVMQLRPGWKALLVDNADAIEDGRRLALVRALAEQPLDTVILCAVDDGVQPPPDVARTVCLRRM